MGLPPSINARYSEGLLAGIAARGTGGWEWTDVFEHAAGFSGPGAAGGKLIEIEKAFDLRAALDACAAVDRAPDALERRLMSAHGLVYLGSEMDGFAIRVELPETGLEARALRELAATCQRVANGSVQIDEQGGLRLQVVSVCDVPEALRQIEAANLKTGNETVFAAMDDLGEVPVPVLGGRLLSGQMLRLAGLIETQGGAGAVQFTPEKGLVLLGCPNTEAAREQARNILGCATS